jgi:hypothetical protein
MWTAEQRARHKTTRPKEGRGYPPDISDKEWKLVEPLLPGSPYRVSSKDSTSRGHQCAALPGPFGLRVAHAVQ